MKRILCILLILTALPLSAQVDRKEVRAGNRKFRKADYKNAEIDYRRAVVKDSLSFAGEYNLGTKHSLNVSVTAGIVLWHLSKK